MNDSKKNRNLQKAIETYRSRDCIKQDITRDEIEPQFERVEG